jgi:hypothetical protein
VDLAPLAAVGLECALGHVLKTALLLGKFAGGQTESITDGAREEQTGGADGGIGLHRIW